MRFVITYYTIPSQKKTFNSLYEIPLIISPKAFWYELLSILFMRFFKNTLAKQ